MDVLTIVSLFSHVSVTVVYASIDAGKQAADRARLANVGPQAVASARFEMQSARPGALADRHSRRSVRSGAGFRASRLPAIAGRKGARSAATMWSPRLRSIER